MEQAAFEVGDVVLVCDECGPERPEAGEASARCHRRLLRELLIAVAVDRGLLVDPDTDALDRTLLEVRRTEVLAAAGFPRTCQICQRPADTARAIRGRDGYGYCSEACLEADVARCRWPTEPPRAGPAPPESTASYTTRSNCSASSIASSWP